MQTLLFGIDASDVIEKPKPKREKPAPKPIGEVDITANRHKGHKQSEKAFELNKERLKGQAARVYDFIASCDGVDGRPLGAIADEVSKALHISGQSSSARMADLKRAGMIFETELERITQWQNTATVCVIAEHRDKAAKAFMAAEANQ